MFKKLFFSSKHKIELKHFGTLNNQLNLELELTFKFSFHLNNLPKFTAPNSKLSAQLFHSIIVVRLTLNLEL